MSALCILCRQKYQKVFTAKVPTETQQKYRLKYHKNTDSNATKIPITIAGKNKSAIFASLKYQGYEVFT